MFFYDHDNLMEQRNEQKGITFDHDFSYSFTLFSSLLKKEGRRTGKIHAFLLDRNRVKVTGKHKRICATTLIIYHI